LGGKKHKGRRDGLLQPAPMAKAKMKGKKEKGRKMTQAGDHLQSKEGLNQEDGVAQKGKKNQIWHAKVES